MWSSQIRRVEPLKPSYESMQNITPTVLDHPRSTFALRIAPMESSTMPVAVRELFRPSDGKNSPTDVQRVRWRVNSEAAHLVVIKLALRGRGFHQRGVK